MPTTEQRHGTRAIDRAAGLLVRIVEGGAPSTVGALAEAAQLPKSTTSRLLAALERHALVRREADGGLHPGPVLIDYARRGGAADLAAFARPLLERLADETGETVNLGVPTAAGTECVAQVDTRYLIGVGDWVGVRVPDHASALGKALLAVGAAQLPPGPLEAFTPATLTDRGALEIELERIRRRGFATTVDELEPGLLAAAAAVRGSSGSFIAALSVSGPSVRLAGDDLDRIGERLAVAATELSARLTTQGAA